MHLVDAVVSAKRIPFTAVLLVWARQRGIDRPVGLKLNFRMAGDPLWNGVRFCDQVACVIMTIGSAFAMERRHSGTS